MLAVLGGLGAACSWAGALLCASRATKLIGPPSVLAWVMLTGLVVVGPIAAAGGVPEDLGRRELGWLLVSGAGNVAGLLFSYAALRVGKVSVVGPISSTEGAIAALLAILAGETLGGGVAATLALVVVGVVLAGIAPDGEAEGNPLRATLLAVGAAVCFGVSLYATARVSESLPIVWAVLPARVIGVVVVAIPLLALRRIRLTRRALPFVVASGLCEIAGFASYALGSRHGIAVAAVLASQFAAVAAVAAYVLFHERLTRVQLAGVVVIAVGVAVLTGLQA